MPEHCTDTAAEVVIAVGTLGLLAACFLGGIVSIVEGIRQYRGKS